MTFPHLVHVGTNTDVPTDHIATARTTLAEQASRGLLREAKDLHPNHSHPWAADGPERVSVSFGMPTSPKDAPAANAAALAAMLAPPADQETLDLVTGLLTVAAHQAFLRPEPKLVPGHVPPHLQADVSKGIPVPLEWRYACGPTAWSDARTMAKGTGTFMENERPDVPIDASLAALIPRVAVMQIEVQQGRVMINLSARRIILHRTERHLAPDAMETLRVMSRAKAMRDAARRT
jgi:hypothetical protein